MPTPARSGTPARRATRRRPAAARRRRSSTNPASSAAPRAASCRLRGGDRRVEGSGAGRVDAGSARRSTSSEAASAVIRRAARRRGPPRTGRGRARKVEASAPSTIRWSNATVSSTTWRTTTAPSSTQGWGAIWPTATIAAVPGGRIATAPSMPKGPTLVMVSVVPSMSAGVVVPARAVATSASSARAMRDEVELVRAFDVGDDEARARSPRRCRARCGGARRPRRRRRRTTS